MMDVAGPVNRPHRDTDPSVIVADDSLTATEARYVTAARAANTMRGYRSDWAEFTTWCTTTNTASLPAEAAAITGYLTTLAERGAKVGTMSRRLSAIKFAHTVHDLPDPPTTTPASLRSGKASAVPTPLHPSKRPPPHAPPATVRRPRCLPPRHPHLDCPPRSTRRT